jgi:hypothetical protein
MMVDGGIFRMLLNRVVALDWGYAGSLGTLELKRALGYDVRQGKDQCDDEGDGMQVKALMLLWKGLNSDGILPTAQGFLSRREPWDMTSDLFMNKAGNRCDDEEVGMKTRALMLQSKQ